MGGTNPQRQHHGAGMEMSAAMSFTLMVVGALIFCAMSSYVIRND